MATKKDLKQLRKKLEEQGFEVVPTKKNHYLVYKGKDFVTALPSTPSEYRGMKNSLADLKRFGFVVAR
ncbi:hypothetical protein [Streptomyces nigrescens]|uniref:hypothetical protein n=1 Tax=Streptomyces nigrescens TaxID=1920 RepID=UPI0036F4E3F4